MPTPAKFEGLKRLVCIGRDARYIRAVVDLNYPSEMARRRLIVVERDEDVTILKGYGPGEVAYIPMSPTQYQLDFLATCRYEPITIENAREWLHSIH